MISYRPLFKTMSEKNITSYALFKKGFSKATYYSIKKGNSTYKKVSFADFEAGNYPKQDEWLYSSFWYKNFDAMAFKTMLRQLISKWGIMSIDLQTAFEQDTIVESGGDYVEAAEIQFQQPPAIEGPDSEAAAVEAPDRALPSVEAAGEAQVSLDDI